LTVVQLISCACKIQCERLEFVERCKAHKTVAAALAHTRSISLRHGNNPSQLQLDAIDNDLRIESQKSMFQKDTSFP